jgi:hypothetical protein
LDNLGNIAHSDLCGPDYDLVAKIKPCISLICNAVYWDVNDWDFCNVPCGIGKSFREITCTSLLRIESDSACYNLPTPITEKICNTHVRSIVFIFQYWLLNYIKLMLYIYIYIYIYIYLF